MAPRNRQPTAGLRLAVQALPERTREGMLRGIAANRIIVGAYVDRESGGVCPMLAAHRNGGRTSLASFARAWDAYTGAKRPRRATRREVEALRALLSSSLGHDHPAASGSIAEAAARIRADRAEIAEREALTVEPGVETPKPRVPTGDRHRGQELRDRIRWSWMRPARRYEEFKDLVAAAEEQLAEQLADEVLGERSAAHLS